MPRIGRIVLVGTFVALMAVVPAVAQAKVEESGTVRLRAYAPDITGYAGPVHTHGTLPAGSLYVAEVSGAISYWSRKQFKEPSGEWDTICGEPLKSLRGPLGLDAEFVFARPWTSPCPEPLPGHWENFELSAGGTYAHPLPFGGPFSTPTPGHKYSYALVGAGGPAMFRLRDMPNGHPATADNYGFLRIHVRKALASDCAGTGYTLFDEPTEAACVEAIA